ncbi:MAG: hydroxyacylglutathione hydrolase [Alphaproteobacteria bacterium]|nr:hydroxyacylglutathione hydrolase [Alphaproteobacteria bacterium]
MLIEQIYTDNAYRNFNYLIACSATGEALAVDPLESELCLRVAKSKGWDVRYVLNTHEHRDHTGGNDAVVAATRATVMAHAGAKDRIAGMDRGLKAGDIIKIGTTVELEVLDTPGHTMSHVCLRAHGEQPALICGDTLFNAGAGNCHSGGHPEKLYSTFSEQLALLPDATLIYPGHDYIANNLGFTLDREPDNARAKELLERVKGQDAHKPLVTTIGLEREINTFFRLSSASVIRRLRDAIPDFPAKPTPKDVFVALRALRNKW